MNNKEAAIIAGFIVAIAIVGLLVYGAWHEASKCTESGGVLMRDALGRFVCIGSLKVYQ